MKRLCAATTYAAIVGRILARERGRRSLTGVDVSATLGLNQSTYSRIERGTSALTVVQLAALAGVLKRRPHEILAMADHCADYLTQQGVRVVMDSATLPEGERLVAVGAGALMTLVDQSEAP